ncbi:MAG: MBG domain-containing protein [Pseudomonadota bacterium]
MSITPFRLKPLALCCLLAFAAMGRAGAQVPAGTLPTGGAVTAGQASIARNAQSMQVRQTSQQAIIDWQSYNIGRDASVQYIQPNAGASVLNRVLNGSSEIAGRLTSNGRVFLVNPNGVLFSPSARVDVGSLGVAAGSIDNAAWLAGAAEVRASGAVVNQGEIRTADGGSVALVGQTVRNTGSISAPQGAITLAAGDAVRLNITPDGLIQAQVTGAAAQSLVDNSGLLASESGRIALAASTAAGTAGGLVANSGIVRAAGVVHNGGTVSLTGGTVQAGGTIDAGSQQGDGGKVDVFGDLQNGSVQFTGRIDAGADGSGNGGQVETSAAHVTVKDGASVNTLSGSGKAGTWLIDPQDFTVGSASGDDISGSTLSTNLNRGNVTINSTTGLRAGTGNIFVHEPVSWSANTTLTLTAVDGIKFLSGNATDPRNPGAAGLANMTATGDTAGLVLNYGSDYDLRENRITLSGATPSLSINGTSYIVMNAHSTAALNTILRTQSNRAFALTSDIDASATAFLDNGQGWLPVGDATTPFSGIVAGFGHTINRLFINRPNSDNIGLFGVLSGQVRDLGLTDPNITGGNNVGGLAGKLVDGATPFGIKHSYVTSGPIKGTSNVGGLLGLNERGGEIVSNSYTSGLVITSQQGTPGGLFSNLGLEDDPAIVRNSYYDISLDNLNGTHVIAPSSLYSTQFAQWLKTRSLNIGDYASSLPFDSASGAYLIGNVQGTRDMLGFLDQNVKFRLSADINLNIVPDSSGWYIPYLLTGFDGAGHTISGLNSSANTAIGLVGRNKGTIQNLTLTNVALGSGGPAIYAGGAAGINYGVISNVNVNGSVAASTNVGGLVGWNRTGASVTGSTSNTTVRGSINNPEGTPTPGYGGLVGYNEGNISASSAAGSVDGAVNVGGLVGALNPTTAGGNVRDSYASASITVGATGTGGGLIGVDVSQSAGQAATHLSPGTVNSYFDIDAVSVNNFHIVSLGGLYHAQFQDWLTHGKTLNIANYASSLPLNAGIYTISSVQGVKDLLGFSQGTLKFALGADLDLSANPGLYIPDFSGQLNGAGHRVSGLNIVTASSAGLFGVNRGTLQNIAVQNATVKGANLGGALTGLNLGSITGSSGSGNVQGDGSGAGGLVGLNVGTIADSLSNAVASGFGTYFGGLVGINLGQISNSYATGAITSGPNNGGLVGTGAVTLVSNSYWDTQQSGIATSPGGGAGKTTAQLQQLSTFSGWDFSSTWNMTANGPVLRALSPTTTELIRLLITANNLDRIYGNRVAAAELSVTPTGLTDGDSLASLGGTLSYTGSWQTATNVGVYTIIPSGLTSSKYNIVFVNGTLNISKAPLTINALDASKIYGAADPILRYGATGLKFNDTAVGAVSGVTLTAPTGAQAVAGTHVITATGGTADNYEIKGYTTGTLTVAKAPLTLTASNAGSIYGADPQLSFNASGLAYSDTAAVVSGVTFNTTRGAAAVPGKYPITLAGGTAANYDITAYRPGELTVDKGRLTVRADDKFKHPDDADPALTYSVSGLAYNDTAAVLSGVALSTARGADATLGTHPIVASGGIAQNYIVTDVGGTLFVALPPVLDTPVPEKALELLVVEPAGPHEVEAEKPVATIGGVVSAQRKALFEPANNAISKNPNIATLSDCSDTKNDGECIAHPRVPVQARIDTDGQQAPAAAIRRKLALVIGNQAYPSPLSSLEGAGADATAVSAALQKQGYEVTSLSNATRIDMVNGMNKLIKDSEGADSVMVFYAGHGHIHPGSSVGYWIPSDARIDNPRGWLSNIDIARFLANIPARQVLLVSDSCFSGALTRESGNDSGKALSRNAILNRRSVVALSSGGEEVVADSAFEGHSPFTYYLLAQLDSPVEQPAKVVLEKVREQVQRGATQVPAYGAIVSSGHVSGGEYLINPAKE